MQQRAHQLGPSTGVVSPPSESASQTVQQRTPASTSGLRMRAQRTRDTQQQMTVNDEQVAAHAAVREQVSPPDIYTLFVEPSFIHQHL